MMTKRKCDEAFVMLALFPGKALLIMVVLFVVGALSGIIIDTLMKGRTTMQGGHNPIHSKDERCVCYSPHEILAQWKRCSPHRGWLTVFLTLFILGVVSGAAGHHGHNEWDWMRVTLLVTGTIGLLIVATVPEHFLEEHLWNHIAKVHVWRIFIWTLGALAIMHILLEHLNMEKAIESNKLTVLFVACLVGLIPQSGPHLLFVTLYAEGMIPFSTLLASCVVQDGHGMIPLLAHSRRAFVAVKAVNFAIGIAIGLVGYLMSW